MIRWTYGVLHPDGKMDVEFSDGPIREERIRELVGGEPDYQPTRDGAVSVTRSDAKQAGLPVNKHFLKQGAKVYGTVLMGKMDGVDFVGMIGIMVGDNK